MKKQWLDMKPPGQELVNSSNEMMELWRDFPIGVGHFTGIE